MDYYDKVKEAADAVRARVPHVPQIGVVLGSGLGDFANSLADAVSMPYDELPYWPASRVIGHEGRLVVGETADDATVDSNAWVFAGTRTLEAPRAGTELAATARALAAHAPATADVARDDTRLYAVPIVNRGRRLGTVVAAVSLAPYEQTQRTALVASLALGGLLLLVVALAARWLLVASLRPVERMTRQAADWSERDLDRRFGLGEPHDELTELAATLDGLLERLAASLRREQRFSAELSHELRTPLTRIAAEAELALRQDRGGEEYRTALQAIAAGARKACPY